ncbi:hypothetical protein PANI_CDS0092 [Maribacter phage Panino]
MGGCIRCSLWFTKNPTHIYKLLIMARTFSQISTDAYAAYNSARQSMIDYSLDNSSSDNFNQGHYYMNWTFQALLEMWQATGDTSLFDDIKLVIDNLQSVTTTGPNGYQIWLTISDGYWQNTNPSNTNTYAPNGVHLYEAYGFRTVFQFLRIIHQSPILKAANLSWWQAALDWWTDNYWDKWEFYGAHYRRNAYMSSHGARIGLDLYIITNEQKYLDQFENVSFKGVPSGSTGAGNYIQKYFGPNAAVSGGTDFSDFDWINFNTVFTTGTTIDYDHADDIFQMMAIAREEGYYWDTQVSIFDGIALSYESDLNTSNLDLHFYMNQTGNDDNYSASQGPTHFGRFDANFESFLEDNLTNAKMISAGTPVREFPLGILLNNRKILDDGRPVYPENYTPFGITVPTLGFLEKGQTGLFINC